MFFNRKRQALSLLLTGVAAICAAACRSTGENTNTPAGLIVVNAARTGTVKRILVKEDTEVTENAVLLEIAVPSNNLSPNADNNRPSVDNRISVQGKMTADAEQELQRAAVELQRIEPLVAANSAPQAQLDAARAQYQQAQERLDQLRRNPQTSSVNPTLPASIGNSQPVSPPENIVAVRAPAAGNVRVISVRAGQSVKAGEPVATISTAR